MSSGDLVIYLVYNTTNLCGILGVAVKMTANWFITLLTCEEYYE